MSISLGGACGGIASVLVHSFFDPPEEVSGGWGGILNFGGHCRAIVGALLQTGYIVTATGRLHGTSL